MTAARIDRPHASERWITVTAVMFIASMATLARTLLAVKLSLLVLFLLVFMVNVAFGRARIVVYRRLVWFYLWVGLVGTTWVFVGVLHATNYVQANVEAFRLYVVWSAAFIVLYTLIKAGPSLRIMHAAMVLAGILIPLINFVGLYDQLNGLGLFSDSIREEFNLDVGFGDGFLQFNSENIQIMFLVAPYLLSMQFRRDAGKSNSILTKLALVLSLILVVLSGRRALWIVVALTPCAILILSCLTRGYRLLETSARRSLLACAVIGVVGLSTVLMVAEAGQDVGSVTRLRQAFSSDDERTIQRPYLVRGFLKSPVFGSGFGAYAGYLRSDERPWIYELSYYQMLFNLGAVGVTALGGLFLFYFVTVVRLLRRFQFGSAIPFGLLIAFCSLVVGAYSNPYFGGFDSLFFAGLLPYLSTFERGFANQRHYDLWSAGPVAHG